MGHTFSEVFPTLSVADEKVEYLKGLHIEKLVTDKKHSYLRVILSADKRIERREILYLQTEIKQQLFQAAPIEIKVDEKYRLDRELGIKEIFDFYYKNINEELRENNPILHRIFTMASFSFDEDAIDIGVEDYWLVRERIAGLTQFLSDIFEKKFQKTVSIRVNYREPPVREKIKPEVYEAHIPAKKEHTDVVVSKPRQKTQTSYSRAKNGGSENLIWGKDFDEKKLMEIGAVQEDIGEVTIGGRIFDYETREIRNEKTLLIFSLTDGTDSIRVKLFVKNTELLDMAQGIQEKKFIILKGSTQFDRFDRELTIGTVQGIKRWGDFREQRMDCSAEKRVELHCHTKMSEMDGVSTAEDIINKAYEWGQKAIAITDHGVAQAFPEALHAVERLPKDADFKVIYGMEAYLVDDTAGIVQNEKGQNFHDTFVVFDLETTGLNARKDKIIEIGAVKVVDGKITERFSTFVNPEIGIPYQIEELTGISGQMVAQAPVIETVLPQFLEFAQDAVLAAHNAVFDVSFIEKNSADIGIDCDFTTIDTVGLARFLLPSLGRFKLNQVAKALNIPLGNHHRAVDDAECTALIFIRFMEMLGERGMECLKDVNEMAGADANMIRKLPSYHAIILAANETGRINLYSLISESHLRYFDRRPKIPKSLVAKHRDGLVIGSACEAGEVYQAVLHGNSAAEVGRLVSFYDYLEIQPVGNNAFMLRDGKGMVESEEDLKRINREIVALGEQYQKPVAATCDVHFLNPEDEVYRRIIMAGNGFKDADEQAPLYLRTTEEMLEEFAYLGQKKAREVVITNTNKIAGMCQKISPIHPDKFPPVIENSDEDLKRICYERAHQIYGERLPDVVKKRMEKELHSIISNGYAVMYIIAQKLVWKSKDDGYLVGSRGSVGSSFAATMAGITEVNPLSPHYYCPQCHYVDFDSKEVKTFAGAAGCDMPDKACPVCGGVLCKDGFDIPFETFLGFKGDKEPDIDLNFSGEYQSRAHKYTEVIFGEGQTFKAGTIGTMADKTAYGYVKKYFEERGIYKRGCEINRIVRGCTGVKRSTGQHPGGIVVLPHGKDINMFTPVQYPANDNSSGFITTHFDYHSIDGNLLKLDILGHDDPTMIRMLEDLTGVDATKIPLDDRRVLSLFQDTSALHIQPEDIGGCRLGALGIPEFGTDFAMQMLLDTKPKRFSDLVRISGLAHGTDVWLGNAQTLIMEGKAELSTVICTRDDIMLYLIGKGMESGLAFTIMESVRKGKGLKPEWEEAMKGVQVYEWYIDSCKKIKYMYPKAHAAAYVMMAFRIAYFKVYHPLAYYATYFSIRAKAFSYELMCMGKGKLEAVLKEYNSRKDNLTSKEQDTLKDMRLVQEMYARGLEFMEIDIYQAKADRFQVIGDKLMPSLVSIEGMGQKAAEGLEAAAKKGPFLSKDDLKQRAQIGKSVVENLDRLGLLADMPESNQLSLFDLV